MTRISQNRNKHFQAAKGSCFFSLSPWERPGVRACMASSCARVKSYFPALSISIAPELTCSNHRSRSSRAAVPVGDQKTPPRQCPAGHGQIKPRADRPDDVPDGAVGAADRAVTVADGAVTVADGAVNVRD